MYSHFILFLLSFLFALVSCDVRIQCENELETVPECVPCEKTCEDIGLMCAAVCTANRGCYCKNGYLRDSHGNCIEREKCPNFKSDSQIPIFNK